MLFVSVQGLSVVAASRGHSSSQCAGLSLSRPLLLRSTSSRRAGSVVVAHGPSSSAARGIFPDQGSNLCPLHWQADSQPLHDQGSPHLLCLIEMFYICININVCLEYTFCMNTVKEVTISLLSQCILRGGVGIAHFCASQSSVWNLHT